MTIWPFRHIGCDYFFTVNLHPEQSFQKLSLGSGKTVLAGFYISGHTRWFYKHFPKSDYQKMTFAVGRIRKCTLDLKLLVILFCSPEVGLSYHVKCADRSAPPPNLRVSENRSIVHFEIERQFPLNNAGSISLRTFQALKLNAKRPTHPHLVWRTTDTHPDLDLPDVS